MPDRELHSQWKTAHLAPQFTATTTGVFYLTEFPENAFGIVGIHEHRCDHDWSTIVSRDLFQKFYCCRHPFGQHENTPTGFLKGTREFEHLVFIGKARWHRNPVLAVVLFQSRCRKTDRTDRQRFNEDRFHLRNLVGCRSSR